jgi:hypothetical protein
MKDGYVMDKIKEKSAQDNRSVSQWSYLVLRKAALEDDDNVKKLSGVLDGQSSTTPTTTTAPKPTTGDSPTGGLADG